MARSRVTVSRALLVLISAAVLFLPIGIYSALSETKDNDPVVARVNGVDIHESDIAFADEEVGANMPSVPAAERRESLIKYVIDLNVLAQAADKQKIAERADVKNRLAFDHKRLLMEFMLKDAGKAALTDDAEHKVYDDAVKQVKNEEEVHARHILVASEEEAKAIREQLQKGADFATLAKEKSTDPGAAEGGDLGYFTKEQMVPEFAEVAFKLNKGDISEPVKTQFGWHIIKVEDKRIRPAPTFDQVKPQIERYVTHKAQAEMVENFRKDAKIERLDTPAAPAAPAAAPAAPDTSLNSAAPTKK